MHRLRLPQNGPAKRRIGLYIDQDILRPSPAGQDCTAPARLTSSLLEENSQAHDEANFVSGHGQTRSNAYQPK